jgi:hypothetical protein
LHSFVVLCETNILRLISQNLDIFYQIQTKYYSAHLLRTVASWCPDSATKHGQNCIHERGSLAALAGCGQALPHRDCMGHGSRKPPFRRPHITVPWPRESYCKVSLFFLACTQDCTGPCSCCPALTLNPPLFPCRWPLPPAPMFTTVLYLYLREFTSFLPCKPVLFHFLPSIRIDRVSRVIFNLSANTCEGHNNSSTTSINNIEVFQNLQLWRVSTHPLADNQAWYSNTRTERPVSVSTNSSHAPGCITIQPISTWLLVALPRAS